MKEYTSFKINKAEPLDYYNFDKSKLYKGEVVYNTEDNKCYYFNGEEFVLIGEIGDSMRANYETKASSPATLDTNMTLYELNKGLVTKLPALTDEQLEEKYELINEFGAFKTWCMLLNRETNYYTVFHHIPKDAQETFASAVLDCCQYQGEIKGIDWADDNHSALEIWITIGEDSYVFYLFDYSQGVIECQM